MHIVIRADGGPKIGFGHLVRSSVIASEFIKEGHQVTYATKTPDYVLMVCPDNTETITLSDSEERNEFDHWLKVNDVDIVLTDSYEVDTSFQRRLSNHEALVVVVVDDARYTVCSDIVLNGNIYASKLEYDWIGNEPEWLLGSDYLLLRKEIRAFAQKTAPWRVKPERALITMGGSDVQNSTPMVIRSFDEVDMTVEVIIGPAFKNKSEILHAVAETDATINLYRNPTDLANRMFKADFAVSSLGSTTYELLALQTPIIGLTQVSNQQLIAQALNAQKAGNVVDDPRDTVAIEKAIKTYIKNPEYRWAHRKKGETLVDAMGVNRVKQKMFSMVSD